jgi:hypothetical protein
MHGIQGLRDEEIDEWEEGSHLKTHPSKRNRARKEKAKEKK